MPLYIIMKTSFNQHNQPDVLVKTRQYCDENSFFFFFFFMKRKQIYILVATCSWWLEKSPPTTAKVVLSNGHNLLALADMGNAHYEI